MVTYTPTAGYFGADSFTYTATGPGGTSTAATVSITVTTPGAPTVAAATASTAFNTSKAIDLSASVTGVHTSLAVATAPAHGTTSVAGDVVTYTPTSGYFGADSFTYTATGPGGTSAAAAVSITVATPGAPTVIAATASTAFNTAKTIDLSANVTGVHTSLAVATTPAHGTASVAGDVVTYTPTAGYFGADAFTYTATGPGGISAAANVSVTVATPGAPTAAGTTASVGYNSAKAVDLSASVTGIHASLAVSTAPSHGTTSVAGDVITYTPTAGYFGADSFTYVATGPGGTSAAATVTVTVAAPGAPTVLAATASTAFNTAKAIDLSANVTGVHTSLALATTPAHGTTSVAGDVVTYTPTPGYFGADAFTYTASGPGGTSAATTVSVTVAAPGAPTVAAATASVAYNTAKAVDLSASVTGVHTSLSVSTAPAHGTTLVSGDVITYAPAAGYFGADTFIYTATGPGGTSAGATVSVAVATPGAPTVSAATVSAGYNTSKATDVSGLIIGVHSSIAVAIAPSHGSASVAGDVVTYTPTAGYFGPDSFTYTASGPGGTSAAATVSITVAPPGAPNVAAATASTVFNTAKPIDLSASVTGVHTSLVVATAPAHGTTSVGGDVVTYTPTTGYFGTDTFTYTATGPGGTSAAAAVTVTVATPSAPTVAAATTSVAYNTPKAIDLAALVTGVHTSLVVATAPAHGTASVAGDVVTYTPTAGYFGADSFTYTATGAGGTSAAATVGVTVATPGAPTASAAIAGVAYNTPKAIDLAASVSGVHTSLVVATAPTHGTASVAGDVVTYTPTAGYFGADSFTYTTTGPGGTSPAATVSVTVATPNAPTAAAATASILYNTAKPIDLSSSVSGVHSSIAVVSAPAHGALNLAGDVITYTPATGYFGADSFTYTAVGPGGTSAPAIVTVTIQTPGAPTAAAATASILYNIAKPIDLSASVSGVHSSIAIVSAPAHGAASVAGDVVTYTPTTGYYGADTFAYTATGPGGTSAAAAVSVSVATPSAPIAAAATASVGYNTAKAIDLSGSVSGVHTSLAVAAAPAHGTTAVAGDVITYTPTAGYYGADSFTYTATGPGGASAAVAVSITVDTPAAPAVAAATAAVGYNASATAIDLTKSVNGVHTSLAIGTAPIHGTATVTVSSDVISYTPTAGFYGVDTLAFTATGPGGTSRPATLTLTVDNPPAPVLSAAAVNVDYNAAKAIDLSKSVTGVHSALAITTAPAKGTIAIAGDIVTYTPTANATGSDSFAYTATGPGGTSQPATVTLTIAAPPPPTAVGTSTSVNGNNAAAGSSSVVGGESATIGLSSLISGEYSAIQIVVAPQHGTVALAGTVTPQAIHTSALHDSGITTQATSGVSAVYTPNAGYIGPDSFQFVAVGPGGPSAPALIAITVLGSPPIAQDKTGSTIDDQVVLVDLSTGATGGPFTGATIASITPADQATATITQGGTSAAPSFTLGITPKARFSGQIVVAYTLSNAYGTSVAAKVTITVAARPDPSADPTVRALSDAQAEAARQLGRDQIDNFMRRTEQLHGVRDRDRSTFGARLGFDALMSRQPTNIASSPDDILTDRRLAAATDMRNADAAFQAAHASRNNLSGDPDKSNNGPSFWTGGSVKIGTLDPTTRRAKLDVASVGVSAGADLRISDRVSIGVGGGYGTDGVQIDGGKAHLRATSGIGMAYLSATPVDGSFVDATAGYGGLNFRTRRLIAAGSSSAIGSRGGNLILGSLSAGLDRTDGKIRWALYGRGIYERATMNAYSETGAGLYDLRFDTRHLSSLSAVLGGRIAFTQKTEFGAVTPWARGEWTHEFQSGGEQRLDYADIAGAALYGIDTEGWRRERFNLSIGSDLELQSAWTFGIELGAEVADKERAGTARVEIGKKF